MCLQWDIQQDESIGQEATWQAQNLISAKEGNKTVTLDTPRFYKEHDSVI
jgi:hypothetical protein